MSDFDRDEELLEGDDAAVPLDMADEDEEVTDEEEVDPLEAGFTEVEPDM